LSLLTSVVNHERTDMKKTIRTFISRFLLSLNATHPLVKLLLMNQFGCANLLLSNPSAPIRQQKRSIEHRSCIHYLLHSLTILTGLVFSLPGYAWYDNNWNYRVPIEVPAGAPVNSTITVDVNFIALLATLGATGTLDINSPRIVRPSDLALAATQEFTDSRFNNTTDALANGRGEVRFLLEDAGASTYFLYFDITANGTKPVNPQTPINGHFEFGGAGVQNPPAWTATKVNNNFDAQIRPSENPNISDPNGTPTTVTTDGTPLTGNFSYLLGSRTNNEPTNASPAVTLRRSITVPATTPGNLTINYRLEGWDSSDNGTNTWDYLRVQLISASTTEITGPTFGNYVTFPFSPNKGTGQISNNASGYGNYNFWDMSSNGVHRSGMTLAAGSAPWFTRSVALASFAGQTITLQITMNMATQFKSWVHIDDVEWSVITATLGEPTVKSQLDHIEILHANGNGVTCSPSTLTIRACANASCTDLYTSGVSGTLSATGTPLVNWVGGTGFTIPAGSSSVTKSIHVTTAGNTVLSTNFATACNFGTPMCRFTAADAGFLFDIPDHTSELAQNITISAVKKADNSLSCTPAFASVSKNINFKCAYSNPVAGTLPVRVASAAMNAANNVLAACDTAGRNTSLAFNASGVASTTFQYADVGRLSVTATYTGAGADAGLVMTGADNFIAAPASFAISSVTAPPIKAGENFSAMVTARNAANATTPNFGKESPAENIILTFHKCQPTGINAVNGNFTGTVGIFTNGVATGSNLNWSEVGNGDLNASLASASYLGSGLTASGNTGTGGTLCNGAGNVGRFIPHHFNTIVTLGCGTGGFTYSAQPFRVEATALNALGNTTQNYDGSLSTTPNFAKVTTLSNAGSTANFSNHVLNLTDFASGVGMRNNVTYTNASAQTAPLNIVLRATDTDNVTSSGYTEGSTQIRSGRIMLQNAYGSELLDLPLTMVAQYWNNNAWLLNSNDSCTTGVNLTFTDPNLADGLVPTEVCVWDTGNPGSSALGCGTAGTLANRFREPPSNGDFNLNLRAPGAGNSGSLDVTAVVPDWLKFNWTGAGLNNPSARATFGIYKTPVIYIRENY